MWFEIRCKLDVWLVEVCEVVGEGFCYYVFGGDVEVFSW